MLRDVYFRFLFAVLVFVALGHFLGIYSEGYAMFWWVDIVVHFLGGVWVGGMTLWLFFRNARKTPVLIYAAGFVTALIVGIAWEIYEIIIFPLLTEEVGYVGDTVLDLVMDSTGGIVAAGLFLWNKKKTKS